MSSAEWQTLYDRFDPEEPAGEAWRAEREQSPARDILVALDRPKRKPKVLFLGTRGTGKTTELLRVADERAKKGAEFVVFLDLAKHFEKVVGDTAALEHVNSWEVCFLVGVALLRAAKERLGHDFDKVQVRELEESWKELARVALPAAPQVDVFQLARSMTLFASTAVAPLNPLASVGLTALANLTPSAKWNIPFGSRGTRRMEDQETAMKRLLESVNVLIDSFRRFSTTPLFVLDGLDRIESFDRAETLLLRSEMIQSLDCPLVVCGPFPLRHHLATATARRFDTIATLHNAPVLDHDDPSKPGHGTAFFGELFRKRAAERLLPAPLLDRLAYFSGGRSRDFVKLVRKVADHADAAGLEIADEAAVERAIDEERRLLEGGITRAHVQVLEQVVQDPRHELPDGSAAEELLTYGRLLPYRNRSEWFYPHPLLMLHKVRPNPTGSNG